MADTLQSVSWCIEYACPFRQGLAIDDVAAAHGGVGLLTVINVATRNNDVYGDYCVTGESGYMNTRSPWIGGRISEIAAPVGSLDEARRICAQCPANALAISGQLAGCCGGLRVKPEDREVDRQIASGISAQGLAMAVAESFLKTTPRWYGLWARSPLDGSQTDLLRRIVPDLGSEKDDVFQFRTACELAIRHGLRLHASMAPPGHTDFGDYTVFPHCPRCMKATGEQWCKASIEATTCKACGQIFIPADTASQSPDPYEPDLTETLESGAYDALREEWKRRHGGDATWDPLIGPPNTPALERMERAEARELKVACVAFVTVFLAMIAVTVVLLVRYTSTSDSWFIPELLVAVLAGGVVSLLLALFAFIAAHWVTKQIHGLRGMYICRYCHGTLSSANALCDCLQSSGWRQIELNYRLRKRRRRWWRHYHMFAKRVLPIYALAACIALPFALRHQRVNPWWMDFIVGHVAISSFVGLLLTLGADGMKWLGWHKRRYVRMRILGEASLIWPLCVAVLWVIAMCIR